LKKQIRPAADHQELFCNIALGLVAVHRLKELLIQALLAIAVGWSMLALGFPEDDGVGRNELRCNWRSPTIGRHPNLQ
jgi:hypothetical protein